MVCRMPVDSICEAPSTNTTRAMPPVVASVVVRRTQRLSKLYFKRASTPSSLSLSGLLPPSTQPAQRVGDPQLSQTVDGRRRRQHRQTDAQHEREPGHSLRDQERRKVHSVLQGMADQALKQRIGKTEA